MDAKNHAIVPLPSSPPPPGHRGGLVVIRRDGLLLELRASEGLWFLEVSWQNAPPSAHPDPNFGHAPVFALAVPTEWPEDALPLTRTFLLSDGRPLRVLAEVESGSILFQLFEETP